LESIDWQNPCEQYIKQNRTVKKHPLKFDYNKTIDQIDDEFQNNKQEFYKNIVKNRHYKIENLR